MRQWCAADMHTPGAWQDSRWNIFTGEVIAADSAPRDAGNNGKKVFNAVLQDETGVITVCAWAGVADDLCKRLNRLEQENETEDVTRFWLRVELFSINQMRHSPTDVCPIAVVQTIPPIKSKGNPTLISGSRDADLVDAALGTQFTIVEAKGVNTPTPSAPQRLRSSLTGVTNFEVLGQLRPPFRVNIAGVVVDVSDLQPTVGGSGKPVRTLVLSDPHGCQISIRQLDRILCV